MRRGINQSGTSNRAEEIRKRRSQRSQQRVSMASNRVVNPVRPARPVTVRGNVFGTPIHQQSSKRTRRAFYVTMDQAGAELRLPSIPLVNPGWRILSGIIAILAVIGIFSLWSSPFFQVQGVEAPGLQRLSADEINAKVSLDSVSIIEVDAGKILATVSNEFPDLANVRVTIALPNVVSIQAEERQPVVAVQHGDAVQWIDAEGVVFPARGDAGPLLTIYTEDTLPAAPAPIEKQLATAKAETTTSGENTATAETTAETDEYTIKELQKVDPALLLAAQGLSQRLTPETKLVYSAQNGLGWSDPSGWQVYIGNNLSDFEQKFSLYQTMIEFLSNQGIHPVLVSVAHLNAPFYRLEQ